jgi:hypothetical protein
VNGYPSHNRNAFGFTASAGKLIKSQVLEIIDAGPCTAHSTGKNAHLPYLERPGSADERCRLTGFAPNHVVGLPNRLKGIERNGLWHTTFGIVLD